MTSQVAEPLVLMVAPNGARRTKTDHAAIPVTPEETADVALSCLEAGANAIHFHVRDAEQKHSLDIGLYREALAVLADRIGERMVVQVTTEAIGIYTPAEQRALVRELQPDAISIAVKEFFPTEEEGKASSEVIHEYLEAGCSPQFIVYSPEDLTNFNRLCERGLIPTGKHNVLFVLGRYTANQQSDPADLIPFVQANEQNHRWSICAFGSGERACAAMAMSLGGHVRLGFENSLWKGDGTLATSNEEVIGEGADLTSLVGRRLATIAEARPLLKSGG
jgi:3-keto-5-aminohexanoate cleavage enzyme